MAIDRIGKGGAPPAPEPGTAEPAKGPSAPFTVSHATRGDAVAHADPTREAGAARPLDAAAATTPLARLRAGEIDVHGYVDLQVDDATKNLKGLSTAELSEIKSILRDQMRTDPALVELVRAATGKAPTPPEE